MNGRPCLRVLICDSSPDRIAALREILTAHPLVVEVSTVDSLAKAKRIIRAPGADIAFIGLSALGRYEACEFIFAIRRKSPDLVFVLCDGDDPTPASSDFYHGERARLLHYYRLDPAVSSPDLGASVAHSLASCLIDLGISLP